MHTFQQDNAQVHTARVTAQVLGTNNVPLLERPALSPALSPVKHFWDYRSQPISRHH